MSRVKLSKGRPTRKRRRGKRVLIACNADITEPSYFKRLRDQLGLNSSLVPINNSEKGKDPLTLVRAVARIIERDRAEAKKEGFEPYAHTWAVTDADEFEIGEAAKEAKRAGIGLAISNPCFEVWLIDHGRVCPSSCYDTPSCERVALSEGVVVSTDVKRSSRGRMKGVNFEKTDGRLEDALKNASVHNTEEKRLVREGNPDNKAAYAVWTDVPKVIEELKALAQ